MNPLRIADRLRIDYLRLLTTTFSPRQPELGEDFRRQIERDGFLTREPFVSLAQPYRRGSALVELASETRERFGAIPETPYQHQAAAVRRILAGQAAVIATGTGSGKTEAFLMPIVDHCLRNPLRDVVKAVLVYPMNALANDQRDRIRRLLAGSDVSFGVYTGETKQWGQGRPENAPENERITRAEFRAHPPDLLLTNYRMLEYLLLRGDGREIFRNHAVRFVVLDEVHTYRGALGTDMACLLRRLRAALGQTSPLFVGTSATLQSGDGDPRAGVAEFFARLTGQPTPAEAVIREETETQALPEGLALSAPPAITQDELDRLDPRQAADVLALARRLTGTNAATLGEAWGATALPYLLLNWLREPRSVSAIVEELGSRPERAGVPAEELSREVQAALLIGPCLADDHPLRLRPRVHRFLRGLARFWRCTNQECGRLLDQGVETCDRCGCRSLPLALCRTCGWDFFIGRQEDFAGGAHAISPWRGRRSAPRTTFLYDPPEAVQVDAEELPDEGNAEEENGEGTREDQEPAIEGAGLCPRCLVISDNPAQRSCGCDTPLRPVRLLNGRGTTCPVCRSRYGRFDVITPVSLGNSSALTHVTRTLLRELPERGRKLLVFTDSRQDAAHQARFMEGVEAHLRMRRAIYASLRNSPDAHDLRWVEEQVYGRFLQEGVLTSTRSRDERERRRRRLDGALLHEFVIAPNVRQSLERLGLVEMRYSALNEELEGADFTGIVDEFGLDPQPARLAIKRLLDLFRIRRAVAHDVLRRRLGARDEVAQAYEIVPGREVGIPVAFLEPGLPSRYEQNYKLFGSWNRTGNPAGPQSVWRQTLGDAGTESSLEAAFQWLLAGERYLVRTRIGRDAREAEGIMLRLDAIEARVATSFTRCSICGRIEANGIAGTRCARARCAGALATYAGPIVEGNLYAQLTASDYTPPLNPAEHSAAVREDDRLAAEDGFKQVPPRPNVLVCTPTLELGVNIGDLEGVAMRNVPPSPANYAQRAGRTGRETRTGIIAGFARSTPHDGYFFDHPDEVIAGAIPPPRFNLANLAALARHVGSLVLEQAQLDYPSNLESYLGEGGNILEAAVNELTVRIRAAVPDARMRAAEIFRDVEGVTPEWLAAVTERFPEAVRGAIEQRGALIAEAARRMTELGSRVGLNRTEESTETSYRNLAKKLRSDYRYAYLPTVLAEAGLLPGYAFPGDPGSLSLALDPDVVFAGRLQAQREFCPGQIVYARGRRWNVKGLALNRPGASGTGRGPERFAFTECPSCKLAQGSNNTCRRCNAELAGPGQTAIDAAAFQAWQEEVEPESEEERSQGAYDVRPHPQRDVGCTAWRLGEWRLELRRQESIWWINHGPFPADNDGDPGAASGPAQGFRLCPTCGELVRPVPQPDAPRRGRRPTRDPRVALDPHAQRCNGQPQVFTLGHQSRGDTVRLVVEGLQRLGDEGVSWAWSVGTALLEGARRHFELDDDDLDVMVQTVRDDNGATHALEILWMDMVTGGSGIFDGFVRDFPRIAQQAVRHLEGHDCPASCYRCLRTYRNQRVHGLLNWRVALPYLRAAAGSALSDPTTAPAPGQGPEWEEARREGCESPLELRLLRAIRSAGLPEPLKQLEVTDDQGRVITRADFAYQEPCRVLIYADGLAFHSSIRQRIHDTRTSNRLQTAGWQVLRFVGPDISRAADSCVIQIQSALGTPGNQSRAVSPDSQG
jgi:very-short-patch-repair endonuclease